MPRLIVLGCGTGVGKTHASSALLRGLTAATRATLGLKPIETGIATALGAPPPESDAATLSRASSHPTARPHPLYSFREPISPHLAARRQGREVDIAAVSQWVSQCEEELTTRIAPHMAPYVLVETAGGVFSPVSQSATNFDLACALEPAIWILLAADALGVLHDVTATLEAMRTRGRAADHLVLSASRAPDASTGTNATELSMLRIAQPIAVLGRGADSGIEPLVHALLATP